MASFSRITKKMVRSAGKKRYKIAFAAVIVALFVFSGALGFLSSMPHSSNNKSTNQAVIGDTASTYQNVVLKLGLVRLATFPSLNVLAPINVHPFIVELYLAFGYVSYPPSPTYRMQLGQSVVSSHNYSVWTMSLKPNLKWDNGMPITSTDLNYTLYMEEQLQSLHFIKSLSILNSTTVQISLNISDPGFLNSIIGTIILPYSTFHNVPISQIKSFTNFNNIVADGPYVIYNYTSGENPIIMSPNPYYYEGPSHVKNVDLYLYSSQDSFDAALESGAVDGLWTGGAYSAIAPFIHLAGYSVYHIVPSGYKVIDFNFNTALFNNTTFRQALAYATPREFISDRVYGPNPILPEWDTEISADAALNFSPANLPTYHYNLNKTAQLMKSLGYTMSGGYWVNSTGSKVHINIIFPSDQSSSDSIATLLSVNWTTAGFAVSIQPVVESTFYSTLISEHWQVSIFTNYAATLPLIPLDFNISQSGYNLFNANGTQWFNKTYEHVVEQSYTLSPSSAQAAQDVRTAALIEAKNVIVIPLYEEFNWEVVSNNFYWGSQSNYTGLFNTQYIVQQQLWVGALHDVYFIGSVTSTSPSLLSPLDYAIIGVVVAAVVIAAVIGGLNRRSKRNMEKDRK